MSGVSYWLVPPREWPITAWAFVIYLAWRRLPVRWCIGNPVAEWMLPWVGYYAYHPMHDGMSIDEAKAESEYAMRGA